MARATTTGISGSAPENAGAVASGQAAAESAPTVAAGEEPQSQTVTTDGPVTTAESSSTKVEEVGTATAVEPTVAAEEFASTPDAEGGTSFDYGQTEDDGPDEAAVLAEKVARHDAALRQDNPDAVVYRDAGSAGEVGGESFTYGQVETD